jgi:hypothetical protein
MVVRWIRKALVLSLAALVARILVAERSSTKAPCAPIPDGPLLIRGTPRVATTAFEPHGAL